MHVGGKEDNVLGLKFTVVYERIIACSMYYSPFYPMRLYSMNIDYYIT